MSLSRLALPLVVGMLPCLRTKALPLQKQKVLVSTFFSFAVVGWAFGHMHPLFTIISLLDVLSITPHSEAVFVYIGLLLAPVVWLC